MPDKIRRHFGTLLATEGGKNPLSSVFRFFGFITCKATKENMKQPNP